MAAVGIFHRLLAFRLRFARPHRRVFRPPLGFLMPWFLSRRFLPVTRLFARGLRLRDSRLCLRRFAAGLRLFGPRLRLVVTRKILPWLPVASAAVAATA